MNLSSVPPYAKIDSTAHEKKCDRNSATSSGFFVSDIGRETADVREEDRDFGAADSLDSVEIEPLTISSTTAGE